MHQECKGVNFFITGFSAMRLGCRGFPDHHVSFLVWTPKDQKDVAPYAEKKFAGILLG